MSAHKNDGIYTLPSEVFDEANRNPSTKPQRICLYNKREFTWKLDNGNLILEIWENGEATWNHNCYKDAEETRVSVLHHIISDFPEIANDLGCR